MDRCVLTLDANKVKMMAQTIFFVVVCFQVYSPIFQHYSAILHVLLLFPQTIKEMENISKLYQHIHIHKNIDGLIFARYLHSSQKSSFETLPRKIIESKFVQQKYVKNLDN